MLAVNKIRDYRNWLYLLTALVMLLLGWSAFLLVEHPYSGMTWSFSNGLIINVDAKGPAAGLFEVGSVITKIDEVPVYEARFLPNRHVGDWVTFTINRQGVSSKVTIQLVATPTSELAKRLAIIPVAFAFWLLGTLVLAFGQNDRLVTLFYLFCQTAALTLGLGAVSAISPAWSWQIFGLMLWWVGPLALHTHLALSSWEGFLSGKKVLPGLYALALLLSLADFYRLQLVMVGPILGLKYIWVGICLLASAGLLIYTSWKGATTEQRRRTKIAGISAISAFLPSVFFSLIPDALTGQYMLPYDITMLALLILPLGYSYSILLYRLVKMEREISQSAAYALATFIVFVIYAFLYIFITDSFSSVRQPHTLIEVLAVLVLMLTAHPMHQALARRLYLAFYGGWVDDRGAVKRISEELKHVKGDTVSIAQTLCHTIQRTLLLESVSLVLGDGRLIQTGKDHKSTTEMLIADHEAVTELFQDLQNTTGREMGPGEELRGYVAKAGISEHVRLDSPPKLWLLFGGRSNWQGLLLLGSKRGRGDFEAKDLEILEVVLRQAGAALENERLLEEVRTRSDQVRELNRKARWALEVERKRIARDLHDVVIQTLVGVNFQLANVRARNDPETSEELENIRSDLHESLVELRGICADLRPPALDALGLVPALEARITEIKSQVAFEIFFNRADCGAYEIRDDVALCIYRFMQEALINIQKHAEANTAIIDLHVDPETGLSLLIEDDGQGFDPPDTLEVLVAHQHFGLIGLQEQVEAVGGRMTIESESGKGCRLSAWIPLYAARSSAVVSAI